MSEARWHPTRGGSKDEGAYKEAVNRFADGRQLCNCKQAYRAPDGSCYAGCSANLIYARNEIVARLMEEVNHD